MFTFRVMKGVTLLELMVALTIITMVAAVALPSYRNFIARSESRSASATLLSFSQDLQNWRLRFKNYGGFTPKGYSEPYYLPKGSNATNYKYKFKIVTDGNDALKDTAVARNWHIYAFPNTSNSALKYASAVYINSSNEGCFINRDDGSGEVSNIASIECDPTINNKAKPW